MTLEFQVLLGLFFGLLLGLFSPGIIFTFTFTVFFEYFIFVGSIINPPGAQLENRILINAVYFFGWAVSRFLFLRETGFEPCIQSTEDLYQQYTM